MKSCAVKSHHPRKLSYRCSLKYAFTLLKRSVLTCTLQSQKLTSVSCKEGDFTYTAAQSSPARNRNAALLPRELFLKFNGDNNVEVLFYTNTADSARISLQRFRGSSDYINACFIDVSVFIYCVVNCICDFIHHIGLSQT